MDFCNHETLFRGDIMKKVFLIMTVLISFTLPCFAEKLTICSFNIQFLGSSPNRDNETLANVVKDYDIVVIQELVATPVKIEFPEKTLNQDSESAEFFKAMENLGFKYWMSEEDTGTGDKNHYNSNRTEFFVTFYKDDKVKIITDIPHGFIAEDRTNNMCYERVPYAFAFRTLDDNSDFVLISVHLQPGSGYKDRNRRQQELACIADWIYQSESPEKDFIILGDMNIYNSKELNKNTPAGFISLNDECRKTTTINTNDYPYDHVMYRPRYTKEIDTEFDMQVIDLDEAVKLSWNKPEEYPGGANYDHNEFRKYYSDHRPIVFKMIIPAVDDD